MIQTSPSSVDLNNDNYTDAFEAAYREEKRQLGRFNLAVFGKTGAGKSSLVNAIFGRDVAETGIGKPVTTGTTYYKHPSGMFGMFDCVGFETGQSGDEILKSLRGSVEELRDKPLDEQMHVAWYVLRWSDRRFEDSQASFVRELRSMGLPVVLVLSQVPIVNAAGDCHPDAREFAERIALEVGDVIIGGEPIMTNAIDDPHLDQRVHGLMELLDATFHAAPEGVKGALNAAQSIDLERKRRECRIIVAAAAITAAGIGAIPIPFADAPLLVAAQAGMMAAIATRYSLALTPETFANIALAGTAAGGVATVIGRTLGNLSKFVPGIGTVGGGTINATIAATLTTGIGLAWMKVCDYLITLNQDELDALLDNVSLLSTTLMAQFNDQFRKGTDLARAS